MLFLQILKIIGLVLLGIIGLVLFAAGLVLFVPVRYKLRGIKNNETMSVDAEVYWLLKFVAIKVHYDKGGLRKQGRIAFFKFLKDDESDGTEVSDNTDAVSEETSNAVEKQEKEHLEPEEHTVSREIAVPEENAEVEVPKEDKANAADSKNSEKVTDSQENEKEGSNHKKEKRKRVRKEKSKELTFVKRLKNLFTNRDYVSLAIEKKRPAIDKSLKRVGKIITHLLPRKVSGRLEFGFDDPSTTGKVLGVIAALYGRTGEVLKLYPDFQQKVLDGDIKIKGKIRIFTVLLLAALVYFNRDLRKLFKYLKHCTEVDIYEEYLEKQKEKDNGRK